MLTNAAFIVAAVFAARRLAAEPDLGLRNSWDLGLLILLLGAIGIGSALWHSFATGWAVLADVIPITLFINLYLLSFGWRVLRLRPLALAGLWLSYQVLSIGLVAITGPELLNGSVGYLPALAFLGGSTPSLRSNRSPSGGIREVSRVCVSSRALPRPHCLRNSNVGHYCYCSRSRSSARKVSYSRST